MPKPLASPSPASTFLATSEEGACCQSPCRLVQNALRLHVGDAEAAGAVTPAPSSSPSMPHPSQGSGDDPSGLVLVELGLLARDPCRDPSRTRDLGMGVGGGGPLRLLHPPKESWEEILEGWREW